MNFLNNIAIKLINIYQKYTKDKPHTCKYVPSCSNYALDAYKEYNFFYASLLTLFRILRCNPFSKGGYNPIPKYKKKD